jgi:hypothetical protein
LVLGRFADVGVTLFNELICEVKHLLKIIAGKVDLIRRVSHPVDTALNFLNELGSFFVGIGVVVPQEALSI